MFSPPIAQLPQNGYCAQFAPQPVILPRALPHPVLTRAPLHLSPPRMGAPQNQANQTPTDGPLQLRKLFIGGLSHDTDDNELSRFYSAWGQVVDCIVIRDPHTKASRGFGFVTYAQVNQAELAMAHRPHVINGKTVDPKRAIPREDMVYYTTAPNGNYGGGPPPGLEVQDENVKQKVFVHGLERSGHYMVDALREYFSNFGGVQQVEINGKQHKPVAFVLFEEEDGVLRCIEQKEHTVNGRLCQVIRATEDGASKVEDKENNSG